MQVTDGRRINKHRRPEYWKRRCHKSGSSHGEKAYEPSGYGAQASERSLSNKQWASAFLALVKPYVTWKPTTLFSAIPRNCFIYPVVGNENGVSIVCSATDLHATTSLRYQYTPGLDEPEHQYGKASHINIQSSDSNIEIIHSNSVILLHTLY